MVSRSEIGKESQKKGRKFEDRMRDSWLASDLSLWRMRIKDGAGTERPGDELIIMNKLRILAEHKTTSNETFSIASNLKPHQISAGAAFSSLNYKNKSIVFINFKNDKIDKTYAVSMYSIVDFMYRTKKKSIRLEEMATLKYHKELDIDSSIGKEDDKDLFNLRYIEQELFEWK